MQPAAWPRKLAQYILSNFPRKINTTFGWSFSMLPLCFCLKKELGLPWKQKFLVLLYFPVLWYHFHYMNPFLSKKWSHVIFMFWASSQVTAQFVAEILGIWGRDCTNVIILGIFLLDTSASIHFCWRNEKSLCTPFQSFLYFFLWCWTDEKKRHFKKDKINQWHKQSQKEFLAFS